MLWSAECHSAIDESCSIMLTSSTVYDRLGWHVSAVPELLIWSPPCGRATAADPTLREGNRMPQLLASKLGYSSAEP